MSESTSGYAHRLDFLESVGQFQRPSTRGQMVGLVRKELVRWEDDFAASADIYADRIVAIVERGYQGACCARKWGWAWRKHTWRIIDRDETTTARLGECAGCGKTQWL